jgi:hypothetical protein
MGSMSFPACALQRRTAVGDRDLRPVNRTALTRVPAATLADLRSLLRAKTDATATAIATLKKRRCMNPPLE